MRRIQLFICPCGAMDTHLRGYDDVFLFFVILGLDPRTQVIIQIGVRFAHINLVSGVKPQNDRVFIFFLSALRSFCEVVSRLA